MVPAKFYLPPDPEEMSRRFRKHVSKPAPGGVKLQRKVESTERKKVRDLVPHPAPPCPTLPHPPYHTTACEASRPYVAPKDRYGPSPKANPKFKKDSGRDQVTFFRELQVQRRLVHLNR